MDFKSLLSSLDQLSEATNRSEAGKVKHTAEPGGYGRKDDEDDEGKKVKADAPKRGRGRPKKDADETGEVKKYDFSAFGATGKDVKLKPWDKNKTTKHSLKDWIETVDQNMLAEAEQIEIKPASQTQTQVIKQGNKTLGTVSNPQLAAQIKQSIGKGEMSLAGDKLGQEMAEDGDYSAKAARAGKDIGKPGKQFAKIAKSAGEKYGSAEKGKKVAGAILAKLRGLKEADLPVHDGDQGAGLGAGRSQGVLEGAKPDYIDLDKDGNKKETMKKAAADKKKNVKEGMDHRLQAARLEGKAHGLKGHSYNGKHYEDMEEARMYHEGFKEGLDECYGMSGGVLEADIPATVPGMASAAEPAVDEGNAFTAALAKTPQGGKFSVGGKTFTDNSSLEETGSMFESWDNELNNLLNEYAEIQEGMTVSISKGQQGAPDSVSVTAQDGEADQLLQVIKQAGLGLFGGDDNAQQGQSSAMSLQPADSGAEGSDDIGVVDDHDGMMELIRKVTGGAGQPNVVAIGKEEGGSDYEDEEGSHDHDGHDHEETDEETCNECGGMMEAGHSCDSKEMVDEVESEDQQEFEVSEDNAPDSDEAETAADENAEAAEDQALATVDAAQDEEQVTEWANDAGEKAKDFDEESFKTDIDFMTKVISGGLNKEKSTGQTTVPVVASQLGRQVAHESVDTVSDWKALAGIK